MPDNTASGPTEGASSHRPDSVNSWAASGPAAVRAAGSFTPVTSRPLNARPSGPTRSIQGDRSRRTPSASVTAT